MAGNPPADLLVAMFALSVATGGLVLVTRPLGSGGHYHHLLDPTLSLFMNLITFTLGMLQMIVSVASVSSAPLVAAAAAAAAKGLRCLTLVMSFTALLFHFSLLLTTY